MIISRELIPAKATLLELAYTFGMISPKNTIAKVVINVSEMITIPVKVVVPKIRQVTTVARVTIATLIKLLKIRIVARSF
jgi:hypothetical protein